MMLQYDREELYQKVWERPMIKVAEEYSVSSVALGKACRKLSVPVPGRGHWAKLAHGHSGVRKPPLPKLDGVPIIYRTKARHTTAAGENDPEFAAIDELLSSGAFNPPSDTSASDRRHPLIRRTASQLRNRRRKDERGILLPKEPGGLNVRVTAGTLDRALQVSSKVLAVLEGQGLNVEVLERARTVVPINGQHVHFGLEEAIRQIVTRKARVPEPKSSWDYDRTVSYEATGAGARDRFGHRAP